MKPHSRPTHDFRITSVAWHLDIEKQYRAAGFPPLPEQLIKARFFLFVDFLQRHGLTTRVLAAAPDAVTDSTELRNTDLNDFGFEFVRLFHGRWLDRTYKHTTEERERAFLERWYSRLNAASTPS